MVSEKEVSLGDAVHTRTVDAEGLQIDRIRVSIPISALSQDAKALLDYWWVEEFNYAFIDWNEGLIKLYYKTQHYLPDGYEPEGVDDYV